MKRIEPDQVDSTPYLEYDVDGESFTGELVETGRDGELLALETVVDGLPHGPSRSWVPGRHAEIRSEGRPSRAVGISREWHPNGMLARELLFDPDGSLIARRTWDNVGNALINELCTMQAGHVRGQQRPEIRCVELDTLDDENSREYVLDGVPVQRPGGRDGELRTASQPRHRGARRARRDDDRLLRERDDEVSENGQHYRWPTSGSKRGRRPTTRGVSMNSLARIVADRIQAVEWSETDYSHVHSRALLMKEYLRRSALWVSALELAGHWPFFDVSRAIHGHDAAPLKLLEEVRDSLAQKLVVGHANVMAVAAVNLAAMRDQELTLPDLPDLYEPLLVMFERGGGFTLEGSGMVDVDTAGVPIMSIAHNVALDPVVTLDRTSLDAIDVAFESRR